MTATEAKEGTDCLDPGGAAKEVAGGNWLIPIARGVRGELGYWFGGDGAAFGSTG